ncbi:Protein kinase domain [Trypanosoma vivax]|uniref:Protein kinase domain-containing protein n=1 Tax=Trypanosoma vivax (strain Y486) TaxID=1055687 RepID=G0U1U3_TRYVY|nr:putative protein kinase [Trypanosoma vivax]KAH8618791.1 Protein kinase domain [Trypanosoma vivax]CCC50242.1 putative protein kinase [Trypanosoma vivax Y486]
MGCRASSVKQQDGVDGYGGRQRPLYCRNDEGAEKRGGNKDAESSSGCSGGIAPFRPSASLMEWYNGELERGQRFFHAPGAGPVGVPDGEGISPHGGGGKSWKLGGERGKIQDGVPGDVVGEVALYRMKLLSHTIGHGMFSKVMLADMTVHSVSSSVLARSRDDFSEKFFDTLSKEGGEGSRTKYLIACKEYPLSGPNVAVVHVQLMDELRRLTRLMFSPLLLKVLRVEEVYDETVRENCSLSGKRGSTQYSSKGGRKGKRIVKERTSSSVEFCNGSSSTAVRHYHPPRVPSRLRVYMEYAKFGTLRDALMKEVPQKFGKTYMHELTVRAYMRQVLIALALLHENDVVHTDLCAKNIYVSTPINWVYGTIFPAYISDTCNTNDVPCANWDEARTNTVRASVLTFPGGLLPSDVGNNESFALMDAHDATRETVALLCAAHNTIAGARTRGSTQVGAAVHGQEDIKQLTAASLMAGVMREWGNFTVGDDTEASADGCRQWADDEVKLFLDENAYEDGETLPICSVHSGAEPYEALNTDRIEGIAFVGNASFGRFIFPSNRLLTSRRASVAGNSFTANTATYKSRSKREGETAKIPADDSQSPLYRRSTSPKLERGDSVSFSATVPNRRLRRTCVKLGHYGCVRSVLVGDDRDTVHRRGAVTHLAPEIMRGGAFTPESDIYAFAMTFIELTTPHGDLYGDLKPSDLENPSTPEEWDAFHSAWLANVRQYLMGDHHHVALPQQLSVECRAMLRRCLSRAAAHRPTAVELLQHKYFLLDCWAANAARAGEIEPPWRDTDFEAAAFASGLPFLPSDALRGAIGAGEVAEE